MRRGVVGIAHRTKVAQHISSKKFFNLNGLTRRRIPKDLVHTSVFLLCIIPAQEKNRIILKMCLKMYLALNGIFLLKLFEFKNIGSKKIAIITTVPILV